MTIDPHIFRAYDIRGKAHTQLSADACRQIGQAFGTVLRRMYKKDHPDIVVGRDARTHGPELEAAVIEGLMHAGCHVWKTGPTTSPVNYFTVCERKADGSMHVTASHNPKEDNGLKLQIRDAEPFSDDDVQKLRRQIEAEDFLTGEGSQTEINATTPYRDFLASTFRNVGKDCTIVVDAGNGIAGPVNCDVFRAVGATVIELYTEPDGNFPNHPADPSKHATLKDLQAKVQESGADLGFAFDGDGDRLGLVDEKGAIWPSDYLLLLLSQDHLSRHKGKPVIFTVSNSSILETEIKKWGGVPVMCKVGHSHVEHAMREYDALLGGEQSGHFFCGEDYYRFDDALAAALRILTIRTQKNNMPISQLMNDFPRVYQAPEMRPYCPDERKGEIMNAITAYFKKIYGDEHVNTLDGARINFGEYAWAEIRQSNTSPCISICMEARSPEKLKEIQGIVFGHIQMYPEIRFES